VLTEHGCQIAPRTFYAWLTRPPSARALWDTVITEVLAGYYEPDEHGRRKPESLYGAIKMWAHLQRQGISVARCTVERLMRANGWQGGDPPQESAHYGRGSGRGACRGSGQTPVPGARPQPAARGGLVHTRLSSPASNRRLTRSGIGGASRSTTVVGGANDRGLIPASPWRASEAATVLRDEQ